MTVGCPACGVIADRLLTCACDAEPVALPRATDRLVFALQASGRHDEAAVVQEHRPDRGAA